MLKLRTELVFVLTATLGSASACKKDAASDTPAASSIPAVKSAGDDQAKPAAPPAAAGTLKLSKVDNLLIDVPGSGADVHNTLTGDPGQVANSMVIGDVTVAVEADPKSLDDAKAAAVNDNATALTADALPDGWALSWTSGSSLMVKVRRDISGKTYMCTTSSLDAAMQTAAVAACKSLRK